MNNKYEYKNKLRKLCIKKRNSMSIDEAEKKSEKIYENLFSVPVFQSADFIMSYVSFKNEVITHNIITELLSKGKQLAVPLCVNGDRELLACKILKFEDLSPGTMGILEPSLANSEIIEPHLLEVIIVPGTAFDRSMNRLGMGAGYYDRFLPKLSPKAVKIGLAYDFQLLDSIPAEKHDIPMDYIITESEIIQKNK